MSRVPTRAVNLLAATSADEVMAQMNEQRDLANAQGDLAAVLVAPALLRAVKSRLTRPVRLFSVVSFGSGLSKPTVKAIEATSCVKDGADDVIVWPFHVRDDDAEFESTRAELLEIARGARAARPEVRLHWVLPESVGRSKSAGQIVGLTGRCAFDGVVVDHVCRLLDPLCAEPGLFVGVFDGPGGSGLDRNLNWYEPLP